MVFEDKIFNNESINVDENEFHRCKFHNCIMRYNGTGTVALEGNTFDGGRWLFEGPAANTIAFMTALYAGGGKSLIEATFDNIRKGSKPPLVG